MPHIVLIEPEIPPNTGNIIRLCAACGAELHLVEPLGFRLDDKSLRRAGLDYHDLASVTIHRDWASCRQLLGTSGNGYALTTKAESWLHEARFTADDWLVFGPESRGLPETLLTEFRHDHRLRLPMLAARRSLNLANAVAIASYELWRQLGFNGAQ